MLHEPTTDAVFILLFSYSFVLASSLSHFKTKYVHRIFKLLMHKKIAFYYVK